MSFLLSHLSLSLSLSLTFSLSASMFVCRHVNSVLSVCLSSSNSSSIFFIFVVKCWTLSFMLSLLHLFLSLNRYLWAGLLKHPFLSKNIWRDFVFYKSSSFFFLFLCPQHHFFYLLMRCSDGGSVEISPECENWQARKVICWQSICDQLKLTIER